MNQKSNVSLVVSLLVSCMTLCVLLFVLYNNGRQTGVVGSIIQGQEYFSTTTRNYAGTPIASLQVLRKGFGSLGAVTITGAAGGTINFYDASTTITNTLWATTTLATIPASAAAATYVFDSTFSQGLLIEVLGAAPTSTITWR